MAKNMKFVATSGDVPISTPFMIFFYVSASKTVTQVTTFTLHLYQQPTTRLFFFLIYFFAVRFFFCFFVVVVGCWLGAVVLFGDDSVVVGTMTYGNHRLPVVQ
jgi:hypothetical protein